MSKQSEDVKNSFDKATTPMINAFASSSKQSNAIPAIPKKMRLELSEITAWHKSFVTTGIDNGTIITQIDFKYADGVLTIIIEFNQTARIRKGISPFNWSKDTGITYSASADDPLEGFSAQLCHLSWSILCPKRSISKEAIMPNFDLINKYMAPVDPSVIEEVLKMFNVDKALHDINLKYLKLGTLPS